MKRILITSFIVALFGIATFQAYAFGCATDCSLTNSGVATGYCEPVDGPDGGAECKLTGTGNKSCDGTYEPLECIAQ